MKTKICIYIYIYIWNIKVTVKPVVVCVLGTIPKVLVKILEDFEIRRQEETLQFEALSRPA